MPAPTKEELQAAIDEYCLWLQEQTSFQSDVNAAMAAWLIGGKPVGATLH
jgi:hypothetical protein